MTAEGLIQRFDWNDFRSLETLTRRAGVPKEKLARVVVKELVDNALDGSGQCHLGWQKNGWFFVADNGAGLPGTEADVAELFSIARPLTSSKVHRMPTRGALGNGLRVVAGAVLASAGSLLVRTRGRSLVLWPQESDGKTVVQSSTPWTGHGTRVEVKLGPGLMVDGGDDIFAWADVANALAGRGTSYLGHSSAWWYTSDSFWELLQASGSLSVRAVVATLEGCGSAKAGRLAGQFSARLGSSLSRDEAEALLITLRSQSRPVNPKRLGQVGDLPDYQKPAKTYGTFEIEPGRGREKAVIPFAIEVWARVADEPSILVCVNRTPITADVIVARDGASKTDYRIYGCNLGYPFTVGRDRNFAFLVNVQSPHMPITTDGKEPDLDRVHDQLLGALTKAAARAKRAAPATRRQWTRKDIIIEALPDAIAKASGQGEYRYSLRQLFYAVRPRYLEAFEKEPSYSYFSQVITEHEAALDHDLVGIYRDTRGILYHPHTREKIPLGTLSVEAYLRPPWTFNKVLYCEKEGLFPILIEDGWPERHDCALITSKGFATRAARDVLDVLEQTDETVTVFCIHDADGPGTLIFAALQEGTKARHGRKFEMVNFGLEREEALEMKLEVEPVKRKGGKTVPVAAYVSTEARRWLQSHRVELNAMPTPVFLKWLDEKMQGHEGKLVPPGEVLSDEFVRNVRDKLEGAITDRILREAGVAGLVEGAFQRLGATVKEHTETLGIEVEKVLDDEPKRHWKEPVEMLAEKLVKRVDAPTDGPGRDGPGRS